MLCPKVRKCLSTSSSSARKDPKGFVKTKLIFLQKIMLQEIWFVTKKNNWQLRFINNRVRRVTANESKKQIDFGVKERKRSQKNNILDRKQSKILRPWMNFIFSFYDSVCNLIVLIFKVLIYSRREQIFALRTNWASKFLCEERMSSTIWVLIKV